MPRHPERAVPSEKVVISKKHEIMALTLSILRLCPLYLYYSANKAKVQFEWDRPASKVVVSYYFNEVLVYLVEAHVYKDKGKGDVRIELKHLPIPEHTSEQAKMLKCSNVITALYNLMGVITRKVWQNNGDVEDTEDRCIRSY